MFKWYYVIFILLQTRPWVFSKQGFGKLIGSKIRFFLLSYSALSQTPRPWRGVLMNRQNIKVFGAPIVEKGNVIAELDNRIKRPILDYWLQFVTAEWLYRCSFCKFLSKSVWYCIFYTFSYQKSNISVIQCLLMQSFISKNIKNHRF